MSPPISPAKPERTDPDSERNLRAASKGYTPVNMLTPALTGGGSGMEGGTGTEGGSENRPRSSQPPPLPLPDETFSEESDVPGALEEEEEEDAEAGA